MSRPTMADVAARAGVTVATVSRALNERTAGVQRPETIARVRAAADELGYRPNAVARGLRTQRSNAIGMLVSDVTNPFMPPLVRAVEDVVQAAGYTLILSNTDNDVVRERRAQRMLTDHRIDAVVLATARLGDDWHVDELDASMPVVCVNRRSRLPLPAVVPDESQCVRLGVEHLLGLGHRRIGHVAGPLDISTGRGRAEAFATHLTAAGVHDPALTESTDALTIEEGRRAAIALLDRAPDLTAIFAGNDMLAVGCVAAVVDRGLRVPEDVSVVGFNDMPLAERLDPPLTTVRVPRYEMGRRAGQLLLALLDSGEGRGDGPLIELPGELVARRSSGPAATRG